LTKWQRIKSLHFYWEPNIGHSVSSPSLHSLSHQVFSYPTKIQLLNHTPGHDCKLKHWRYAAENRQECTPLRLCSLIRCRSLWYRIN